jgi:hypothetical protein
MKFRMGASKRLYDTFREAEIAARRRFGTKGYAEIWLQRDTRHADRLARIARDHNGKLVTDLTWEGSKYA